MARTIEETRKAKREFMAKKRLENPDKVRKYNRDFHHKNRDKKLQQMRDYYARRFFWGRAMKLRGEGKATAKDLASVWKKQRGKCALTGRKLDRSAQLDHVLAKARGGLDCKDNLRWLCKEANLARRELSDEEFYSLCEDVMAWIGKRINEWNS
jgi:hypothetical protein